MIIDAVKWRQHWQSFFEPPTVNIWRQLFFDSYLHHCFLPCNYFLGFFFSAAGLSLLAKCIYWHIFQSARTAPLFAVTSSSVCLCRGFMEQVSWWISRMILSLPKCENRADIKSLCRFFLFFEGSNAELFDRGRSCSVEMISAQRRRDCLEDRLMKVCSTELCSHFTLYISLFWIWWRISNMDGWPKRTISSKW